MPMTPEDLEEMKSLIAVARKRALSFGLCLGKKSEGTVLILHRLKDGEMLARAAKKDGETAKVTHGTAEVKGKILTLTCAGDVLPGMSKHLRRFLKEHDTPLKVVACDATGAILDDDGEPEEEGGEAEANVVATGAPEAGTGGTAEGNDAAAQNWERVAAAVTPMVQRAVAQGIDKAAQIEAAWNGALAAAAQGRYDQAMAVAAKIRPLLAGPAAATQPADGDAARWQAISAEMMALYERAMETKPENRTQLEGAWAMAVDKADAGDFATAMQIVARLRPALEAAIAKGGNGAAREIPKDVVPFQKSRVLWSSTRNEMRSEMAKLEGEIARVCGDDPELADVVAGVSDLRARLDVFDARLEEVLDRITVTPEGDARSALKVQAAGILQEYAGALEDDFFKDVDSANGFVTVNVAANARRSLDAIRRVVAA